MEYINLSQNAQGVETVVLILGTSICKKALT